MLKVVSSNAQCVLAVTEIISDFSSIYLFSLCLLYVCTASVEIYPHCTTSLLVTKKTPPEKTLLCRKIKKLKANR